jgi:hypothetical protein
LSTKTLNHFLWQQTIEKVPERKVMARHMESVASEMSGAEERSGQRRRSFNPEHHGGPEQGKRTISGTITIQIWATTGRMKSLLPYPGE